MMSFKIKTLFCFCTLTLLCSLDATAQKERKFVREGNKEYEKGNFDAAQTSYLRAINIDSTSYEALFNLSDALYQQKNYDDALSIAEALAADSLQTDERTASSRYNLGNIYFQKKEYQKAIDEYKKSLRIRPDDYEAKFNLAYAQQMLQNQQQQQNQDNKQDQDKNQDKDKEQDKKDQQQPPQDQNQDKDKNKEDQKQQQEPKEGEMSKKDAEQILKAMQNNENKTQEKVKDQQGTPVNLQGRKNW